MIPFLLNVTFVKVSTKNARIEHCANAEDVCHWSAVRVSTIDLRSRVFGSSLILIDQIMLPNLHEEAEISDFDVHIFID